MKIGVKFFERDIDDGVEERMPGRDQFNGVVVDGAIFFVETNERAARNVRGFGSDGARDVTDLETTGSARIKRSVESFERGLEKILDEIRLEFQRIDARHGLFDAGDGGRVESVFGQGALTEQLTNFCRVERFIHEVVQSIGGNGIVAVTDRLDDQLAQRLIVERNFAENVKDLAAESIALVVEFF